MQQESETTGWQHTLNVHFLPQDVAAESLAGSVVVVIDLLRATTTICHAIAAGACEVVPFLDVDDALKAAGLVRSDIVLGGERHGGKIRGFDLGNSPAEYTPEKVGGKRVFITTTNGTRALHHARLARRVLVGALVNLSAIASSIKDEPRVDILCAGTGGKPTREDMIAAGAMVDRIAELGGVVGEKNTDTLKAYQEWNQIAAAARSANRPPREQVAIELRETQGGKNLLGIGLDRDLVDCAKIDLLDVVPELDLGAWRIR